MEHNGEFLKYALDTLFNIMKGNGEWDCQAPKETEKGSEKCDVHYIPSLLKLYDSFVVETNEN